MSTNEATLIVNELYLQSCTELLHAYGLTAELRKDGAGPCQGGQKSYISALSSTGDGISVLSTLSVDTDVLASSHPSRSATATQHELEDWCRELNNQLVGRLKNKLLHLGCDLATGLPFLVMGTDVSAITPPAADVSRHVFRSPHGGLALTLATQLSPEFTFMASELSGDVVMIEGAVDLF